MSKLVVVSVLAIFAFPFISAAQAIPTAPFSIAINPIYPAPHSAVALAITSGAIDVTYGVFNVYINGKQIATGTGTQSVSFVTGAAGKTMKIVVAVTTNGVTYKKALTITPEDTALVVEPLSTAPPFYKGSPTLSSGGSARIVAVPDFRTNSGEVINPDTLSYTWKIGTQTLLNQSGIGRDYVIVPAPLPYRSSNITVLVQSQNRLYVASRNIQLNTTDPVVLIYKKDPLMGIEYSHALSGNQSISGVETSFVAVPYGFSTNNSSPAIVWTLSGVQAQTGDILTLRPQGRGNGSATVSVSASNSATYENANAIMNVLFGSAGGSGFGLFGL